MLGVVILLIFVGGVIVAFTLTRRSELPTKPQEPIKLYAPGSIDVAGEVYHPARKDGAMPFPVGKKKERKRTETFRKHSKD